MTRLLLVVAVLSGVAAAAALGSASWSPESETPGCLRRPPAVQLSFEGPFAPGLVDTRHGSVRKVRQPSYDGGWALRAVYDASGELGYARVAADVSWHEGDDVWFGGAFLFPRGFLASNDGVIDIMRWDNHALDPRHPDHGGLTLWSTDGRLHLIAEQEGGQVYRSLLDAPPVAEGRWLWLEVHQRLATSAGNALNELYVDGLLVGRNGRPNYFGRPVSHLRWGLVAVATGRQQDPAVLYLDRATASGCEVGPRDWSPTGTRLR